MARKRDWPLIPRSGFFRAAAFLTFAVVFPVAFFVDWILYRVSVKNRWRFKEYIFNGKKKAIIVSNHTTFLDPVKMCAVVTPLSIHHTVLEATMRAPFLGTFIRLLGGMPMPSPRGGKERFVEGMREALSSRRAAHVYPEGECFLQSAVVGRFHSGAFVAAMALGVPVFPVATVFTEPMKIFGWKSVRPRATLYVLPPIYPGEFESAKEFAEFTREKIQGEINARGGTNAYCKGRMARIKGVN